MSGVNVHCKLGINFLFHSTLYSHKCAYIYFFENTIAHIVEGGATMSPETIKKLSLYRAVFFNFLGKKIRGVIE